jgi:hypothetical protein
MADSSHEHEPLDWAIVRRTHELLGGANAMGRYIVRNGASRFDVRDDRDAVIQRGVALAEAFELVHQGCRFCEAGQNHTNDAVRLDLDPGVPPHQSARSRAIDPLSAIRGPERGDDW